MRRQKRRLAACALCALVTIPLLHGQRSVNDALRSRSQHATFAVDPETPPAVPPTTVEGALREMFAAAAIIFTGQVRAIERQEDTVTTRFDVEDDIRGVTSGTTYSLREWSGLWTDSGSRYTVGQHLLLLLHAPSVAGLASPVKDGAIPLQGDAVTGTADLRWVALHTVVAAQTATSARLTGKPSVANEPVANTAPAPDRYAHFDRAVVADLLHAWQRVAERAQ